MLMRHIVLALCVIVGLVWQTSIFLQVFPNDLLQSLGYSGASLFLASMTLGVGVVTLNAWEQLTGATKTTGVSTGGIFCAAPVFKLIWFPYMEFETTPQQAEFFWLLRNWDSKKRLSSRSLGFGSVYKV